MDDLAALRLQIEWGADEAIEAAPIDRTALAPPVSRHAAVPNAGPRAAPTLASAPPPAHPPANAKLPGAVARAQALARSAPTLEALRDALAGFSECPLAATAGKLVFADGNPGAGVVLVGDVPGPEEDVAGLPFQGPAGQLLDRMLASIGLDRDQVRLTMLIPWRPPGNRPPTESEVAMCLPFLQRHLALLRPQVVVTFGMAPTRALTGSDAGIRRLRGRWTDIRLEGLAEPVPTLPMAAPASLIASPATKRDAWADLLTLRERLSQLRS